MNPYTFMSKMETEKALLRLFAIQQAKLLMSEKEKVFQKTIYRQQTYLQP